MTRSEKQPCLHWAITLMDVQESAAERDVASSTDATFVHAVPATDEVLEVLSPKRTVTPRTPTPRERMENFMREILEDRSVWPFFRSLSWATMHSQCGNQSMLWFWIERSSESESFQLDFRSCTLNTLLFATHRATHLALVAGLSCGLKVKRWWLRRMVSSTSPSRCSLLGMDCYTFHSATTLPFSMNSFYWRA